MIIFHKLLVLLLFRYINCAGLFETCKYEYYHDTYIGYCEQLSDCKHRHHVEYNNTRTYCDSSLVCCAPVTPLREVDFGLGGIKTYRNEFPHMALIGYEADAGENQWLCSGSLITNVFVLSAAHCNTELTPTLTLLGATDYVKDYESSEIRSIIEVIDHPDYDFNLRIHDICLYRLNASIVLTKDIKLICLPDLSFQYPYHYLSRDFSLVATGWGATSLSSGMSQILLKMYLQQWDRKKCTIKYDEAIQLCAGSDLAIDTCSGDSGGPIQVMHKPSGRAPCSYIIIGITSHGKACFERNGTTSIYTKVTSYLKWIKEIVWYGTMDCDLN